MKSRNKQIDVLRGFAVLGIVSVHTSQYFSSGSAVIDNLLSSGRFGVQLFFLVSAYSLSISWSRTENACSKIYNFYLKRAIKIIPLFFFASLLYVSLSGLSSIKTFEFFALASFTFIWFPSLITNIVPGSWSIGIEVLFYIIFPFIVFKLKNKKHYLTLFFIFFLINSLIVEPFVVNFLQTFISDSTTISNYIYLYPLNQIPVFFIGLYLFFFPNFKNYRFELIGSFFVLIILLLNQLFLGTLYKNTGILFFMVLILLTVFFRIILNFNMKNTFFINNIGVFSYEIYFLHFAILRILEGRLIGGGNFVSFLVAFSTTLALSFVVAYIFNLVINKHVNKFFIKYLL